MGSANRSQNRISKFPGDCVWRHESASDEVTAIPLFGPLRTLASSHLAIASRGSSRCGGRHTANAGGRFGVRLPRLPFRQAWWERMIEYGPCFRRVHARVIARREHPEYLDATTACRFAPPRRLPRLTSRFVVSPRRDPRFREDDTCWLGRSRCAAAVSRRRSPRRASNPPRRARSSRENTTP